MILFLLILFNFSYSQIDFESPLKLAKIQDDNLDEISGIDQSSQHDIIWCHNDSGGENIIFGLNSEGKTICKLNLVGINNRDWEDISYGKIDDKYYIFVGEIGDNNAVYPTKFIYYFEEPSVLETEININDVKKIEFRFPDKNYDCEALMFDPISRDLILITKRQTKEKVYRITYPYNTEEVITAEFMTETTIGVSNNMFSWVTAADISDDGKYILIKNYTNVYFWERGDNLYETISKTGFDVSVYSQAQEPQGEAICFDSEANGFYTVSEEIFGIEAYLHYFKMIDYSNIKKKVKNNFNFDNPDLSFFDLLGNQIKINELENYFNKPIICIDNSSQKIIKIIRHSN